jgi:hypothetical protein
MHGQSGPPVYKSHKSSPMLPQVVGNAAKSTELSGRAKRGPQAGHGRSAPRGSVMRVTKTASAPIKRLNYQQNWRTFIVDV